MTTHQMKLHIQPFDAIKAGTKTIEMRLYDEKRRKISVGDTIIFTNEVTKETINVQVVALHIMESFEQLYNKFNKLALGYMEYEIALYTDMEAYYLPKEIKKYGVVGIEIRLI